MQIDGPKSLALALSRPGKTLVLATDYGGGGEYSLRLDTCMLGLKETLSAKDAETGESLPIIEGRVRFSLKKHDFRMVVVTEKN